MKIKLLKTHTHASEMYLKGETLEVSQKTADWLIKNKIGEQAGEAVSVENKPATKPAKGDK